MIYLNSYSIDEMGIKMRNLFFLVMLASTSLYYVIQQEKLPYWYIYVIPLIYIVLILLIFFTRNSFGKKNEDFIQLKMSKILFCITFTLFILSPLLHTLFIPLMPGDLISQLSLSFVFNFIIGYFSFKILLPDDLSRVHATEYRNSAVTVKVLERESTGKASPSIKAELKLKINANNMETMEDLDNLKNIDVNNIKRDVRVADSEDRIEMLLKEQEELMKIVKENI